jgi:uncharacterized protein (TIGR02466 family)|tara:strand:+ start:412 stop:1065 length:654 start_codon:yes stop_codon:yes gene_type:complete
MSEMQHSFLFPTLVWEKKLDYAVGKETNWELEKHMSIKKSNEQTTHASNYGGWQSEVDTKIPFQTLQDEIDKAVEQVCRHVDLPKLQMTAVWYNVNEPGNYNSIHNHPGSIISGVYYVDIPHENMGDIVFHRGDDAQYFLKDLPDENRNSFKAAQHHSYTPKTGLCLLFPSWLKHSVEGNLATEEQVGLWAEAHGQTKNVRKDRLSLSFNYSYVPEE